MSTLHVERRETGKAAKLRKRGLLPMALVEKSHTTTLIQATEAELKQAMAAADGLGRLDLEIAGEGKSRKVIVKQIDRDFLARAVLNVTLQEVGDDDQVKVDLLVVPINIPSEVEGSDVVLSTPTDHIKVKGAVSTLPEKIEVDVSQLQVGGHINAGDIQLPDGVVLVSSPDATVFSIAQVKETSLTPEMAEAEAPAADEPPADDAE